MVNHRFNGSVISHRRGTTWGLIVFAALALLVLTACDAQRIVVPPKDGTPPSITMNVNNGSDDTFTLTETSADMERSLGLNSRVILLAIARDMDGGVQNVSIDGEIVLNCHQGDLGRRTYAAIRSDNPQSGGIGSMGLTALSTSYVIDVRAWVRRCPAGWTFDSVGGTFFATGRNYHGGTATTSAFSFSYP
jgi:hypothetical protein